MSDSLNTSTDVYMGQVDISHKGKLVGKFNVFADAQDLTDATGAPAVFTYDAAVARMAELNGATGESYKNEEALTAALESGAYQGGKVIAPLNVLKVVVAEGYKSGDLSKTFSMQGSQGNKAYNKYGSSTPAANDPAKTMGVQYPHGVEMWLGKEVEMKYRPVTLVRV